MLRKCKGKYGFWEKNKWVYEEFELGYFHTWGCDYEEFETGAGNYSVAIVELPNGKVVKVNPIDLEFLDTKEYCDPLLGFELDKETIEKFIENCNGSVKLCQN